MNDCRDDSSYRTQDPLSSQPWILPELARRLADYGLKVRCEDGVIKSYIHCCPFPIVVELSHEVDVQCGNWLIIAVGQEISRPVGVAAVSRLVEFNAHVPVGRLELANSEVRFRDRIPDMYTDPPLSYFAKRIWYSLALAREGFAILRGESWGEECSCRSKQHGNVVTGHQKERNPNQK